MPNRRDPEAAGRGTRDTGSSAPPGVPPELADLPWALPHSFLGLDEVAGAFEPSAGVILPVPYESTTSWGSGTRRGPQAIIESSRYIELYDQEASRD